MNWILEARNCKNIPKDFEAKTRRGGFSLANIFRFKLYLSSLIVTRESSDGTISANRFRGAPAAKCLPASRCSLVPQVSFAARLLTLSTSPPPGGSLRHLISSRECAQVTTRHHATLCVSDDSYSIRQQSACSRSFLLGQPPVLHPIQSSRFKRKHSVLALICISIILPEMIKSEAPDLIFSLCISIMNSMLIFRLSLHFRMDPVELEDAAVELMGNVKKNSMFP